MPLARAALLLLMRVVEMRVAALGLFMAAVTIWVCDMAFAVGIEAAGRYLAMVLTTTAFAQGVLSHIAELIDDIELAGTSVLGGMLSLLLAAMVGALVFVA